MGIGRRHRHKLLAIVLVVLSAPCAADSGATEVFRLIDERLDLMADVALYKARNEKPVEDSAREEIVVMKAKERALKAGIDPDSIERFFRAQIGAAKAIQHRYLADWSLAREMPAGQPKDLIADIRPELIRLGESIVVAVEAFLRKGYRFSERYESEFLSMLAEPKLEVEDKRNLYRSMAGIALSNN